MTVCEVGDVVTVDQTLILRRVGRLDPGDHAAILQALDSWLQMLGADFAAP